MENYISIKRLEKFISCLVLNNNAIDVVKILNNMILNNGYDKETIETVLYKINNIELMICSYIYINDFNELLLHHKLSNIKNHIDMLRILDNLFNNIDEENYAKILSFINIYLDIIKNKEIDNEFKEKLTEKVTKITEIKREFAISR